MRLYPLRLGLVVPPPPSSSSLQCTTSGSSRRALSGSNSSSKHKQLNSCNSLLQLCTDASTLQQVHARYVIRGLLHLSPALSSQLLSSYARLGHLSQSLRILVHHQMRRRGGPESSAPLLLDAPTLVNLLRSCADCECLGTARSLHRLAIMSTTAPEQGGGGSTSHSTHHHHHHVNKALLSVYSKLGCLEMARAVFEHMPAPHGHCGGDTAAWNLMIAAESRHGHHRRAIQLLIRMGNARVKPDLFTAIAAISAASELKALDRGREIHAHVIRTTSSSSSNDVNDDGDYGGPSTSTSTSSTTPIISAVHNSLIEMYAKCGCLGQAKLVFDQLGDKSRSVVSWSSMVRAYVIHGGHPSDALALYQAMKLEGVKLDRVSMINLLPACVQIGALGKVMELHLCCIKLGFHLDASVVTALLVSYAKCGCIETAQKLFDQGTEEAKDVISWNSMITAYAKHGNWPRCFQLYSSMKKKMWSSKVVPDGVTFIGLLTACVNSGLVEEGWNCFMEMVEVYGYEPKQEHYACMVDLLGRHGQVDEAMKLVKTMPFEPDVRVWGPLLSAYKLHSKPADVAEFAAQRLIGMEPKNAGNYVLISNIYAAAGKWDQVAKMRGSLRDRGLKKTPGCSWLEINGSVHEFRVADRSHPMSEDIYAILMNLQLKIIWMSKEMIDLEQTSSCIFQLL